MDLEKLETARPCSQRKQVSLSLNFFWHVFLVTIVFILLCNRSFTTMVICDPIDTYIYLFLHNSSSNQRKEWGEELRRIISRDHAYVLVTCEQLVGVCLFLFIRPHLVPFIR